MSDAWAYVCIGMAAGMFLRDTLLMVERHLDSKLAILKEELERRRGAQ